MVLMFFRSASPPGIATEWGIDGGALRVVLSMELMRMVAGSLLVVR